MWKRIVVVIGGGIGLMGCATFKAGAPAGQVDIIAHRGASANAPENTLAAFRLAADMKAHWFELDCTLTKDNQVVVIHDDTIARTAGGAPGEVKDLTLAEMKRFDVGSWFDPKFSAERFPSLGEALDLAKGKIGVYIEIKNSDDDSALTRGILADFKEASGLFPQHADEIRRRIEASGSRNAALARAVVRLVRERHMQRQVVIQSFSPIVCAVTLIEAPDLRTELLAATSKKDPGQWPRFLEWLRLLDPHGFNPGKDNVTQDLVRQLHARGKSIAVWTVDDTADMTRLREWGVDALITNKPDLALEVTGR